MQEIASSHLVKKSKRLCEVCGSNDAQYIYKQEFIMAGIEGYSYDVVACNSCGFAFADNLPSPEFYESYYQNSQKYTYEVSQHALEPSLERLHYNSYELIDSYIRSHYP